MPLALTKLCIGELVTFDANVSLHDRLDKPVGSHTRFSPAGGVYTALNADTEGHQH